MCPQTNRAPWRGFPTLFQRRGHKRRLCGRADWQKNTGGRTLDSTAERLCRVWHSDEDATSGRWQCSRSAIGRRGTSGLQYFSERSDSIKNLKDKLKADLELEGQRERGQRRGRPRPAMRSLRTASAALAWPRRRDRPCHSGTVYGWGQLKQIVVEMDKGHMSVRGVRGRRTAAMAGRYHEICTPQRPFGLLRWQARRRLGGHALQRA